MTSLLNAVFSTLMSESSKLNDQPHTMCRSEAYMQRSPSFALRQCSLSRSRPV
jgi:hypothetical protein